MAGAPSTDHVVNPAQYLSRLRKAFVPRLFPFLPLATISVRVVSLERSLLQLAKKWKMRFSFLFFFLIDGRTYVLTLLENETFNDKFLRSYGSDNVSDDRGYKSAIVS